MLTSERFLYIELIINLFIAVLAICSCYLFKQRFDKQKLELIWLFVMLAHGSLLEILPVHLPSAVWQPLLVGTGVLISIFILYGIYKEPNKLEVNLLISHYLILGVMALNIWNVFIIRANGL